MLFCSCFFVVPLDLFVHVHLSVVVHLSIDTCLASVSAIPFSLLSLHRCLLSDCCLFALIEVLFYMFFGVDENPLQHIGQKVYYLKPPPPIIPFTPPTHQPLPIHGGLHYLLVVELDGRSQQQGSNKPILEGNMAKHDELIIEKRDDGRWGIASISGGRLANISTQTFTRLRHIVPQLAFEQGIVPILVEIQAVLVG